tara:strand:- start:2440 stop:2793 length:354 start_codon:yes stop_codon:yes gene_type:complete
MSKVYIIQEPAPRSDGWTPDMSTAAEHGALVNVFDKADRIYADTAAAVEKAKSKLKDFNPEEDFLLWAGFADPSAQWVVSMSLVALGHNKVNFLFWSKRPSSVNKQGGYYFPITIKV